MQGLELKEEGQHAPPFLGENMDVKDDLRKKFSNEYEKHYKLDALVSKGFSRKTCPICGRGYWTIEKMDLCSECQKPVFEEKKKVDYIEIWKRFENFFREKGHASIPRYPVICRWRDDLHFTIASVVDFMRLEGNNIVWEYPANPLIVPQMCLRFNDIPNVGKTGKHFTSFIMAGQHAFNYPKEGYWKEECIEHNYNFLTSVAKVPKEKLVYMEDVWSMPDLSSFGPSIETHVNGIEIVNSVFTEFKKIGGVVKEYEGKVIDVGWGFERIVWFMGGGSNAYEHAFGSVSKMFSLASNEDELQALYAICDHARTLLFAITDGALPSNVGGGYNLRIILRRAQNTIEKYGFKFSIFDVMEMHAHYLHPLFPELRENLEEAKEIVEYEIRKYRETLDKNTRLVSTIIEKKDTLNVEEMIKFYESYGITAETINEIAEKEGKKIAIPENFYEILTDRHLFAEKEEKQTYEPEGFPETKPLYYSGEENCEAEIIGIQNNAIVLNQTVFYPEGGGQASDVGYVLKNGMQIDVFHAEKVGGVIFHKVKSVEGLSKGDKISCAVDGERREIIRRHHSATHIIGGVCRKMLGKHVWQAGAKKTEEKAHLDITHYEKIPDDLLLKLEREANRIVFKGRPVNISIMERGEAERKYGFILYQGGGSPGKFVRVVDIEGVDVEACAGLHVKNTQEIGVIKIIKQEKIQDGILRLTFVVSQRALEYVQKQDSITSTAANTLSVAVEQLPKTAERFFQEWKDRGKTIDELERYVTEKEISELEEIWEEMKETHNKEAIVKTLELPISVLNKIAIGISQQNKEIAVCLHNEKEIVCACGEKSGKSAKELLDRMLARLGGTGGGNEKIARGKIGK